MIREFLFSLALMILFIIAVATIVTAERADTIGAQAKREVAVAPKKPDPPPDGAVWGLVTYPPKDRQVIVVWRVIDGDTVEGGFVLGPVKFRLNGIDAPELPTPRGVAARARLEKLMPGMVFQGQVHGQDKFGRTLVDFWEQDKKAWISTLMIESGHAVPYDGGKR